MSRRDRNSSLFHSGRRSLRSSRMEKVKRTTTRKSSRLRSIPIIDDHLNTDQLHINELPEQSTKSRKENKPKLNLPSGKLY